MLSSVDNVQRMITLEICNHGNKAYMKTFLLTHMHYKQNCYQRYLNL